MSNIKYGKTKKTIYILLIALFNFVHFSNISFAALITLPYSSSYDCIEFIPEVETYDESAVCQDGTSVRFGSYATPAGLADGGTSTTLVDSSVNFSNEGILPGEKIYFPMRSSENYPERTITEVSQNTLTFDQPLASAVANFSEFNTDGETYSIFNYKLWSTRDYRSVAKNANRPGIIAAANNPLGAGKGKRIWLSDGRNMGGDLTDDYEFSSPQPELWVRWYEKYQPGFAWLYIHYIKEAYFHTGPTDTTQVIPDFIGWNDYALVSQGTSDYYQAECLNCGWQTIMGGNVSDGEWHMYEIHLKMDTNQANGIGEFWVDGVQKIDNHNVDWSDGRGATGWSWFQIKSNQALPDNGFWGAYMDIDDVVISNTTPQNIDGQGTPYIGPIVSGDTIAPNAPSGLLVL
ncbi:MAG: hypothetical protein HGA36_04385 [Candidatus Moranbacteria bacterium]|nr:hypothetical protein [Candidatus Moranbacteria bacterium]